MMSDENSVRNDQLRGLAAELVRRRNRIERARRTFDTLVDAYSVVISDLRAASGESGPAAAGGETSA